MQFSIQVIREQPKSEAIIYQDMKGKGTHVLQKALNEVAPKYEKIVHIRKKHPWYNTVIKRQKTVMRNRERI